MRQEPDDDDAYVRRNAEVLLFCRAALRFSGYAFFALAFVETLRMKAPGCLDSCAYGVFLLDAARRVSRLVKRTTTQCARAELTEALESIAQCHTIFAWVTLAGAVREFRALTTLDDLVLLGRGPRRRRVRRSCRSSTTTRRDVVRPSLREWASTSSASTGCGKK